MPAEVESMFSVREVPWHGLGVIVEEAPNSYEALKLAGLDWEVEQYPVYADVDGTQIPANNYIANVRSSDNRVIGMVGPHYKVIQNREAFDFVDNLLDHRDVRFETAGSLRAGQVVWMLARMEESWKIIGDEVTPYLLFANGHNGEFAVRVIMTPIRVVCNNTLNMALQGAKRAWNAIHIGNLQEKLHEAKRTLGLAATYMDRLEDTAKELIGVKVSNHQWQQIIENLIPMPLEVSPMKERNVLTLREDLAARVNAPDLAGMANTGWGVLNAVSDHISHAPPIRQTRIGNSDTKFYNIATGHAMLDRAYKMVLELAS